MKIEVEDFKEHLYKLLLEQYNQEVLFDDLATRGIDMHQICVDNLEIIFDIIGFPDDSTWEHYRNKELSDELTEEEKQEPLPPYFDRDPLREQYYETQKAIEEEEQMFVSEDKVESVVGPTEANIYVYLTNYIDWLYQEKKRMDKKKR